MPCHGDWVGGEGIWTGGGGLLSMGWVGGSVTRWRGLELCSEVPWGIGVLIRYYVAWIRLSAQVRHGCSHKLQELVFARRSGEASFPFTVSAV